MIVPLPGRETERFQSIGSSFERQVELSCGQTRYVDFGRGFPLILVHGLMSYSFCWRKNIPVLGQYYRVLALDLLGCGHSGVLTRGTYGIEAWSRQLEEFLDALGLNSVYILATSAGGAVAVDFMSRCGHLVEKLALVSPVNPFSRRAVLLAKAYAWTGLPTFLMNFLLDRAPHLLPWLLRHRYYFDPARITPETIPGYLEGLRKEVTVPMLRQSICTWKPALMADQLTKVKATALLIWGEADKLIPPACIPDLANALRVAGVIRIPEAGHLCYEERPEIFNEKVLSFFQDVDGSL